VWRRFKLAKERLDTSGGVADNDPLITAYHEAQDRFVDCKVASLQGVLLKLLLIDEAEDLEGHLEEAPRMLWPRIVKSLLRDLKTQVGSSGDDDAPQSPPRCAKDKHPTPAAASAPADAIAKGVADAATGDLHSALEGIDTRMTDVMMAAYDAQSLASLLDTVCTDGFGEASGTDDYWHKRWWEQAGYIARTLERLGDELQANGEAIETAVADIKYGRPPTSTPAK
jgi:hypothetical protein